MSTPLCRIRDQAVIGGVPVDQIADTYGTPCFVYAGDEIRTQYRLLEEFLEYRPFRIYYSVKANSAVGILRLLHDLGAGADICSPGDLAFAEAAGFTQEKISFTGTGLGEDEFDLIHRRPAMDFVADSLHQVARIVAEAPGRPIGLRLNPAIEAGSHPQLRAGSDPSRFGLRSGEIPAALELATAAGNPVVGLHGHLGSDILEVDPFLRLAERLCSVAAAIPSVRWVNLGGGLGVPDGVDCGRHLTVLSTGLLGVLGRTRRPRSLQLRMEPGGYLTMSSGLLLTRVTDVKTGVPGASGGTVCVDASSNHLVSAVIYDTYHPVARIRGADADPAGTYDIAGNLMQAGDVLARNRRLPRVQVGDLLAFGRCGAYSACRSTTFNNRGRPAEVLVLDGTARLLRRREEPADLLRFEVDDPGDGQILVRSAQGTKGVHHPPNAG